METSIPSEAVDLSEERPATQYFAGQIPPVQLAFGYRIGLAAGAVAMMALPLAYLGLVGLFCWGIWVYATSGVDVFFPKIGGTRHVYLVLGLLYLGPLAFGILLVLFMLKPLFARRFAREVSFSLSHLQHPELFRFLGQLCQAAGAPIPSRVDVDLTVNASAGFRAGFGSLFGNDIKLAFGLPLVAGLNCREFAGILAHELGHFTQRTGMRFAFIIHSINRWLACAVYERDAWDEALEEASHQGAFNAVVCSLAQIGIGLVRGILWLLMVAGHALSSFLSRQMEFHADACAIAVAGTDGFVTMGRKLMVLGACVEQCRVQFKNRIAPKLPDDLSTYIAVLASQCGGQVQGKMLQAAAGRKTRWFDSHPSDAVRTAQALRASAPGLIQDLRPAAVLFGDFAELSRAITSFHYQMMLGRPLGSEHIFHVETPSSGVPDTSAEEAAIKAYFGGLGFILRPILLEQESRLTVELASAKLEQLKQARGLLQATDLMPFRESLKELDARLLQALQAEALQRAGVEGISETFSPAAAGAADLPAVIQEIQRQQQEVQRQLEPFEQSAKARLLAALSLLRSPSMTAGIATAQQLQDEARDLLHAYGKLSGAFPSLLELRKEFAVLQALLGARAEARSELLDAALAESAARSNQLLSRVRQVLGSAGYPFEHANGRMSIADYARAREYDADPVRMTQKEAESHLQMLFALYYRLLGRLTAIAAKVEEQLENGPVALQS